jgi:S-adenosylmethionine synthetase
MGIDADSCAVMITLDSQSPDIAMGVDEDSAKGKEIGAGDQGMMFGFACNETKELMPAPIEYAHRLVNKLADLRFERKVDWLRPDAKSQVTMEYVDEKPTRVHTVVISTQHDAKVSLEEIRSFVTENVIKACIPADMLDKNVIIHVNPTGRFVVGGPHGDCGLTGRKIIVDTYGGRGRHGGGAFSGKDPTKVDRSACYMARYVAKNIVAAELADQCEVQVAYAIGVAKPVSVYVNTFGTGRVPDIKIAQAVQEIFPLTPGGIIKHLDLRRPIYQRTAAGGHFGRPDFPWEKTDKVAELQSALAAAAV